MAHHYHMRRSAISIGRLSNAVGSYGYCIEMSVRGINKTLPTFVPIYTIYPLKSVLQKAVLKTESRSQEFIIVSRERQYYFEIKGRIVDVHGPEGIFTYYKQIGELENILRHKGFFGCHKSYLINLKYVDGYNRQEVILEDGKKL